MTLYQMMSIEELVCTINHLLKPWAKSDPLPYCILTREEKFPEVVGSGGGGDREGGFL